MISDFQSDDSMEEYSDDYVQNVNEDIMQQEREALLKKRETNVYDLVGLLDVDSRPNLVKVEACIAACWKQLLSQKKASLSLNTSHLASLQQAAKQDVYTENVQVFQTKTLKQMLLVMFHSWMPFKIRKRHHRTHKGN